MLTFIAVLVIVAIGVALLVLPASPAQPASNTAASTPPSAGAQPNVPPQGTPPPSTTDSERAHDEPVGKWEWLGLIDDTPNLFRCVVSGRSGNGRVLYYISDENPGEDTPYIIPRSTNPIVQTIERVSGKRYFGTPLISSIRDLDIDRVVISPTRTDDTILNLINLIQATGMVKRRGLKRVFPRPVFHLLIDTKDNVKMNLTSFLVFEVVDPRPAFEQFDDSLLQSSSEITRNFVSEQVQNLDFDDFKLFKAGDNKFDVALLNRKLVIYGIRARQHTTSDPEVVKSPAVQAALEAVLIAKRNAEATRETAFGQRDAKITIAEGEAKAIERLAKAEAKKFEELYKIYRVKGLSEAEAIRMAQQTVVAEANAEAIGKLVYYGAGTSGVQLAVPGAEKKK